MMLRRLSSDWRPGLTGQTKTRAVRPRTKLSRQIRGRKDNTICVLVDQGLAVRLINVSRPTTRSANRG